MKADGREDENLTQLSECVAYFKADKGFRRLFVELRKKWKNYGRAAGYVVLKNLDGTERNALRGVLGNLGSEPDLKLSVKKFEEALQETKFQGITLEALLQAYFQETLETNKQVKVKKQNEKDAFFQNLCDTVSELNEGAEPLLWLRAVIREKRYGYSIILSEYDKSISMAFRIVLNVCRAAATLKVSQRERVRLAVLSAEITANPHYFDRKTSAGKLLINSLSFINSLPDPQNAEEILNIYYTAGIQPDDISSQVIAYGIRLFGEAGEHEAFQCFVEHKEPYVVTLANLSKIIKADCDLKTVYAVENQMVFSHLCENLSNIPVSIICTSGQLRTAALILIDLLCQSNCKIYYSGDIDPEGIQIADRVLSRNSSFVHPWRMTAGDYERCLSQEEITPIRMKKLDAVKDQRLVPVLEALRNKKKAGYQELLLDVMERDIREGRL